MMLWKKGMKVMTSAGILAVVFAGTAMAAEERTKITSVELTIDSDVQVGDESGDVSVTTNGSNYSIEDVEIVNDNGEWNSGDVPQVAITLEADSDYYFGSMSSSRVKLRGDDAKYIKSRREDSSSTLIVTIKLDELEGSLDIEDVAWENDDSTTARWEKSEGGNSYQVRLYRGNSSVGETVTTTNTYYNFADRITREGEFYFKVRSVGNDNKKGDWFESDYIYVDEEMLEDIRAGHYGTGTGGTTSTPGGSGVDRWMRNEIGWWYQYANGSYPANGWLQISGVWYCFDSAGYMRTGWIQSGNTWYFCDRTSGAMRTGWIQDGNAWYYCNSSGAMLANTRTPDGYYVGANGAWIQ